jgi:hypothetical protein
VRILSFLKELVNQCRTKLGEKESSFMISDAEVRIIEWLRQVTLERGAGQVQFVPDTEQPTSMQSMERTTEEMQAAHLALQGWRSFYQYPEVPFSEAQIPWGHQRFRGNELVTFYCLNPKCCPQPEMAYYRFNEAKEVEIVADWNPFSAIAHAFEALLQIDIDTPALGDRYRRRSW